MATVAKALTEEPIPSPSPLPDAAPHDGPAILLVTPEDLNPETAFVDGTTFPSALVLTDAPGVGDKARSFVANAARDTAARVQDRFKCPVHVIDALDPVTLVAAAADAKVDTVVTPYVPVGPTADALPGVAATLRAAGVDLVQPRRSWDDRFWPHARKGYFAFKEKLRPVLAQEGLC